MKRQEAATMSDEIPAGMIEVTREEFMHTLMEPGRNVHPSSERYQTWWKCLRTGAVWGWRSRGWMGPWERDNPPPERFAVASDRENGAHDDG